MLAMADQEGHVRSSTSGLARMANVTGEGCRRALGILSSPDPDSGSPEFEGRRIEAVDAGWNLLNYSKYREIRTEEQLRAAARQRRHYHRTRKPEAEPAAESSSAPSPTPMKTHINGTHQPMLDRPPESDTHSGRAIIEQAQALTVGLPEPHQAAVEGALRAARHPAALLAEIKAITTGLHPPVYPIAVIAQALHEIHVAEGKVSSISIRAFCRRIQAGETINGAKGKAAFTDLMKEEGRGTQT